MTERLRRSSVVELRYRPSLQSTLPRGVKEVSNHPGKIFVQSRQWLLCHLLKVRESVPIDIELDLTVALADRADRQGHLIHHRRILNGSEETRIDRRPLEVRAVEQQAARVDLLDLARHHILGLQHER